MTRLTLQVDDFGFLSGLVIYSPYQAKATTWLNSYRRLCISPGEDCDNWSKVKSGAWPTRRTIKGKVLVPGVRNLSRISRFFTFWEGLVIYITR